MTDGPASVDESGEEQALTPSAEQGVDTNADSSEGMISAISQELEAKFGPVDDSFDDQEAADTTDRPDPNDAAESLEASQPENEINPDSASDTPAAEANSETDDDNEPLPDDVPEAEIEAYAPKAGRRVRKLLKERYELRQEVQHLQPLREQIQQNDLTNEDVQMSLQAAGLLRQGRFAEFEEFMRPLVAAVQQATGQALPPDLQEQVAQGYVSPEIASQLAASRAQLAWQESQVEQQRARQQQEAVRQQETALRVQQQAIGDWETQIRQQDPDYSQKESEVQTQMRAILQVQGRPETPEAAVAMARAAYDKATALYSRAIPTRNPTRAVPTAGVSGRAAHPKPQTLSEAVRLGAVATR